jgi:LacI family transcriptional regulator
MSRRPIPPRERSSGSPPGAKRITLRDVAARAGLTPAAASLALRRDRSIPEATRLRVVRAAAELHYVPNAAARALRSRFHRTMGVLIFDEASESQLAFYGEVLLAVADEAIRRGCGTLILQLPGRLADGDGDGDGDADGDADGTAELLAQTPIDAAVCIGAPPGERRERQIAALAATGLPFAFIGAREVAGGPVPHVATDYAAGSFLAVEHLAGLGHRRIALAAAAADLDLPYIRGRVRGYHDAVARLGLESDPELVLAWDVPPDPGAPPVRANAEGVRRAGATAVYAVLFDTARRALVDLAGAGMAVPRDVAVVGFGDNASAASLMPPLTVVRQPLGRLGAAAARLLFGQLAGEAPAWPVFLPPTLVVRRSCGAPAPDEPAPAQGETR